MVNVTNRDIWYALGISSIFLSGFLLISLLRHFLIAPLRQRKQLNQRVEEVRQAEQIRASIFKSSPEEKTWSAAILKTLGAEGLAESFRRQLVQADISWTIGRFLFIDLILALGGFYLGYLSDGAARGFILALVLSAIPFVVLRWKKGNKTALVERMMPDVMELLARSLRAGHSLPSAIELASEETPYPLGRELRIAYEEQRMGIGIPEALRHMAQRVDSDDMRYFVTAILIQVDTGGNLAEIMEKISLLIRSRLNLKAKIRVLSAEGRISALIISLMPFFLFLLFYIWKPDYALTMFRDSVGRKFVFAGLISLGLGLLALRKIVTIRV
jgi:tight adherence protein B